MKALRFDGKKLDYISDYPKPQSDEAVVRVTMAGICGTDLEILQGSPKTPKPHETDKIVYNH